MKIDFTLTFFLLICTKFSILSLLFQKKVFDLQLHVAGLNITASKKTTIFGAQIKADKRKTCSRAESTGEQKALAKAPKLSFIPRPSQLSRFNFDVKPKSLSSSSLLQPLFNYVENRFHQHGKQATTSNKGVVNYVLVCLDEVTTKKIWSLFSILYLACHDSS